MHLPVQEGVRSIICNWSHVLCHVWCAHSSLNWGHVLRLHGKLSVQISFLEEGKKTYFMRWGRGNQECGRHALAQRYNCSDFLECVFCLLGQLLHLFIYFTHFYSTFSCIMKLNAVFIEFRTRKGWYCWLAAEAHCFSPSSPLWPQLVWPSQPREQLQCDFLSSHLSRQATP